MNAKKRAKDYRDPEDIAFTKWVNDNFPIRNKNFKGEVLFSGSKYDDFYLIGELVQLYRKKNAKLSKTESSVLEAIAWVSALAIVSAVLYLILN
jgi:hypothetical protein